MKRSKRGRKFLTAKQIYAVVERRAESALTAADLVAIIENLIGERDEWARRAVPPSLLGTTRGLGKLLLTLARD